MCKERCRVDGGLRGSHAPRRELDSGESIHAFLGRGSEAQCVVVTNTSFWHSAGNGTHVHSGSVRAVLHLLPLIQCHPRFIPPHSMSWRQTFDALYPCSLLHGHQLALPMLWQDTGGEDLDTGLPLLPSCLCILLLRDWGL